ncbi:MAG: damage-control phosphatase ARMT1 family protein [Bacteroidales bacterium]
MNRDCIECFHKQADKLFSKYEIKHEIADEIKSRFNSFVESHNDLKSPEAGCFMHRMIRKATCVEDPYEEGKIYYNELLLKIENDIRLDIHNSSDTFQRALRYALAGNIIDFAPGKSFDVLKTLSEVVTKELEIDHSDELQRQLKIAKNVLYLGDNAGEIVLDKLFIENIHHPDLTFVVRGHKIINDITLEDAQKVGLTNNVNVISNGYDAPSTLVNRCSQEFREAYDKADIIISKGQGNLEGLIHEKDKKIFFLLMIKCKVIADLIDVNEKSIVVMYNQKINRGL